MSRAEGFSAHTRRSSDRSIARSRGAVRTDVARCVHACIAKHRGVGIRRVLARAAWCAVATPRAPRVTVRGIAQWIRRPSVSPSRAQVLGPPVVTVVKSERRQGRWRRRPSASVCARPRDARSTRARVCQPQAAWRRWSRAVRHQRANVVCARRVSVSYALFRRCRPFRRGDRRPVHPSARRRKAQPNLALLLTLRPG